ncbi:hypothetical protein FA95DRAFT_1489854 [Auriscalpium vulgare]|uniref:Uncharacterized protein n=1 Tax=Auriscalpium vulgare TaxID=40419 RepID=A0ACB8RY48_9AGAM|nr:hypothetical protein FA95DRAFT_1489854 [Auriscalpium vulgare]
MTLTIPALRSLQTVEVVDLFCSFFDTSKIPSNLVFSRARRRHNPDKLAVDCAFLSLQGLAEICAIAQPSKLNNTALLTPIAKAWPMIYPWLAVFYTVYTETFKNDPDSHSMHIAVIGNCILKLTYIDNIRLLMANTPGMFKLVAKLWKEEPSGPPPSKTHMRAGSFALQQLLMEFKTLTPFDEVVEVIGSPKAVIQIGMSRLRIALKEKQPSVDRIKVYVDVLNNLTRGTAHPLRHAILHEGGMALVTKAFLKLSTMDPSTLLVAAVRACFLFLHNLVEAGQGIPWIKQIVEEGFLQAYVNASPLFAQFDDHVQDMAFSFIANIIPRYLVFRHVVSAVGPALDKLDATNVRAKLALSPARYQEAWDTMQELAKERVDARNLGDAMRKELGCCNYCKEPSTRTSLRRCSGCRQVYYCSEKCQVADWKTKGHKTECKLRQEDKKTTPDIDSFYRDDHSFHNNLAILDARNNASRLRKTIARDFPGVSRAELGVRIDYTVFPPTYGAFRLRDHECTEDMHELISEAREARVQTVLDKAINSKGQMTLIESIVTVGELNSLVETLMHCSLWDVSEGDEQPEAAWWQFWR